jgi:twitching motility protein PilT
VELGASDIHLKVGQPPVLRRDGELGLLPEHRRSPTATSRPRSRRSPTCTRPSSRTSTRPASSTSRTRPRLPRFRVNGYRQRGSISFAFRVIPNEVPSFERARPAGGVRRLGREHRGLVLCTGATGSGKTTTLAAVPRPRSTARGASTS